MQIHYCITCNSRVDSDEAVIRGDKVYCRPCATKSPANDDQLPASRNTPSRGLQRRTPGKAGSNSPPRGNVSPARSSKYGLKPATAASTAEAPARLRSSGGNAIPARASGANITPARSSGGNATPPRGSGGFASPARRPSTGNPVIRNPERQNAGRHDGAGEIRSAESSRPRNNSTLIWVLAGVALLLAGIGAALIVSGNSITPPPLTSQK